ncbi:MAG: sulfur carrier protein ThiS [Bacteroidales bacterium]|nr:sulfur carrier protein ThiS [Bacteroidales bacterium]MCF8404258.1 sulfur carrier protein ThiS [Bacteroidales bacterium]
MQITINNRPETIDMDTITFSELIKYKNYSFKMLVTKLNGKLVKKEDRDHILINEGDNVSVIHLISGG